MDRTNITWYFDIVHTRGIFATVFCTRDILILYTHVVYLLQSLHTWYLYAPSLHPHSTLLEHWSSVRIALIVLWKHCKPFDRWFFRLPCLIAVRVVPAFSHLVKSGVKSSCRVGKGFYELNLQHILLPNRNSVHTLFYHKARFHKPCELSYIQILFV